MPHKPRKAARLTATGRVVKSQLATSCGVNERTIDRWNREGCPSHVDRSGSRTYDPAEVQTWLESKGRGDDPGRRGRPPATADAPADVRDAQAREMLRKTRAQADRAELAVAAARGKLLPAEEVQAGRLARVQAVTAGLSALPAKIAARCAGRDALEIEQYAREEIDRLREAFAREA